MRLIETYKEKISNGVLLLGILDSYCMLVQKNISEVPHAIWPDYDI